MIFEVPPTREVVTHYRTRSCLPRVVLLPFEKCTRSKPTVQIPSGYGVKFFDDRPPSRDPLPESPPWLVPHICLPTFFRLRQRRP